MKQRTVPVALAIAALVASACATNSGSSAGAQERTVLVDYSHDEFASAFIGFFPKELTARPGDTVVFKQTWTGEPHTVTFGSMVDTAMKVAWPFLEDLYNLRELPDAPPPDLLETLGALPEGFGEDDNLNQTAAQPCYLEEGAPPLDGTPCTSKEQTPFKGTETYYNSGFIPYDGPQGNTFRVPLSEELDPGEYYFYCAVHGVLQGGKLNVEAPGSDIPSQDELNRQARSEIEVWAKPLLDLYRTAEEEGTAVIEDETFRRPFAGLWSEKVMHGMINEFVPKTIRTKVNESVSWKFFGNHTVSFNVPEYFPIVQIGDDGTVRMNPTMQEPQGGSPPIPEQPDRGPPEGEGEGEGPPEGESEGPPDGEEEGPPPEPTVIEAGTWDGRGFWSSGLLWGEPYVEYRMSFSRPGTYRYACLLHPPMIGTLVVTD